MIVKEMEWNSEVVGVTAQGSTLGAQIIKGGPEQCVRFSRVPRNCFQNCSGCYNFQARC